MPRSTPRCSISASRARSIRCKGCLASGYPFVFGFSVYASFESAAVATTGHAPMPKPKEALLGGHAVGAVGYDDAKQWFIARNSWGPKWGLAGYFTLPYEYLLDENLSDDFWTIRLVQWSRAAGLHRRSQ